MREQTRVRVWVNEGRKERKKERAREREREREREESQWGSKWRDRSFQVIWSNKQQRTKWKTHQSMHLWVRLFPPLLAYPFCVCVCLTHLPSHDTLQVNCNCLLLCDGQETLDLMQWVTTRELNAPHVFARRKKESCSRGRGRRKERKKDPGIGEVLKCTLFDCFNGS